jgi:hypothetical protein
VIFVRISTADDKDVSLHILSAIELSPRRLQQSLILFLEIKVLKNSTQNPDLPINTLVRTLNRQKHYLSSASRRWRASLESDSAIDELLRKGQLHYSEYHFSI